MSRRFAIALTGLFCVLSVNAETYTYFEDHFASPTLDPAWTPWEAGSYQLVGSDLEFTTEQGDFHNAFEPTYGAPRHLFLVTPPEQATQWTAVTRVRYNTPDEYHEQVNLMAFGDHDNSVKIGYSYRVSPPRYHHMMLSEENGTASETTSTATGYTDYFWLRLDRDGSNYTAWTSGDATSDPDAVSWTLADTETNPLVNPQVGIGGWNSYSTPTGELAEFDYFRLQVVPEPATIGLLGTALLLVARRRLGA